MNLLEDPLLAVRLTSSDRVSVSLPEALSLLGDDRIESFEALAPHQAHAWHAFLVFLAALALHRGNRRGMRHSADDWRAMLRQLTAQHPDDAPWHLVVDDLSKPAFMQPPVPEGTLNGFKNRVDHPDLIDVLLTAKNHDVKSARIRAPRPEHWVYALISLQTMQGFLGAGNYGIARMNGGFASRPCITLVASHLPGARLVSDVAVLLDHRENVLDAFDMFKADGGRALLWLEPWDGQSPLELRDLDPWFIEICRRVRLIGEGRRLVACQTGTAKARIAADMFKGNIGDPWAPVERTEGKMLTIGARGFDYALLSRLLFSGGFERPLLQRHPPDRDSEVLLLARGLARGQGETNGYHERLIPVPREAKMCLFDDEAQATAGKIAEDRIAEAGTMQRSVLRWALLALLQAGPKKIDARRDSTTSDWASKWLERFDARVDDCFFPMLWDEVKETGEAAREAVRHSWKRWLRQQAMGVLEEAIDALPLPGARRYQAIAGAEGAFNGALAKNFPALFDKKGAAHDAV